MQVVDTDVLIVGAGPTGLTASILLADFGINAITVNQYPGTAHTPRAHVTNIRTIEMFRDMGIESEIAAVAEKLSYLRNNVMAETLAGTEIARYESYGSRADRISDYAQASPCKPLNAPQHVMEPVLLEAARQRGADIRFSSKLVQIEQTDTAVEARIQDRDDEQKQYVVRAKYVIAADGGRSFIAETLGVKFAGEAGLRDMVNVWIDMDLEKYTAYRPSVLYTILKPNEAGWNNAGAVVCVKPWKDWLFISPGTSDIPEAILLERIRAAVGDPDIPIKVKNISSWQVNHLYATTYQVGRVFLAGDAAHRHPPSGGLGTNTSVQDAYNLAWKLAYVLTGKAGDDLLKSYHDERMPVGKFVVERAIKSLFSQDRVATALGTVANGDSNMTLAEIFSDSAEGRRRRASLAEAVREQDYRSNALGVELGQRYESGAVVSDGTPFPPYTRDPELYYHPTTHPGAFVPHAWVQHGTDLVSTVDIAGKGRFGLFVGIGGQAWADAAAKVAAELGIDIPVFAIGPRCAHDDVYGDWARVREIDDGGALLLRPDRYIGWRAMTMADDPEATLRQAVGAILAR